MRFFTFEYQAFNGEINGEINRETNRETNREFIGVLLSALSTDTTRDRNSFCHGLLFCYRSISTFPTSKPKWRSIATPTPAAPAVSGSISGAIAKIHKRHKGGEQCI